MLVPEWGVGAVVAQENHERLFRDPFGLEVIQHVAERLVHSFDHSGESLGVVRLVRVGVILGEAGVGVKGTVHRVVSEVEEERLLVLEALIDLLFCLNGELELLFSPFA